MSIRNSLVLLLLLFLLFSSFVFPISCKKDSPLIYQNIEVNPLSKETILISDTTLGNNGRDETRSYYFLDIKSKKTQSVPSLWKGCFQFFESSYDALDFNDLIGNYKPLGKDFYEVGRFNEKTKQYRTLISDTKVECGMIFDSKKHNLVFYQKGINEQSCQEIWIMDREGKNNKTITNGFKIQVFECRPLDEYCFLIDGLSDYTRNNCYLIYNVQTQKLIVMSDKNLSYDFIDFYDNKILTSISNNINNKVDISLVDFNGVIQKTIFTGFSNSIGMLLLDKDNHRLFSSYVTSSEEFKIIMIDLDSGSEKTLFIKKFMFKDAKEQKKYHPPLEIRYNKQRNDLVFIMERRNNPSEPTTLHFLDLTSSILKTYFLPDEATYCYSIDEQYILCLNINYEWSINKIFDVKKNSLIDFKTKIDTDLDSQYIFSELTNQFIVSPHYSPDIYHTLLVSLDGSVEKLQLPISPPK